jgi:hypothetical protein
VTDVAQTLLLQAAPPLQSALVVQEQTPLLLQDDVAPVGAGQFASVVQVPPVIVQVPAAPQALPLQSAFVAHVRFGRLYVAVQSAAAPVAVLVQPPFWQL